MLHVEMLAGIGRPAGGMGIEAVKFVEWFKHCKSLVDSK
jgi:hypothetical protein